MYLKTRRNIQQQQQAERLGEQDAMTMLSKQYQPITDAQKALITNIISELKPIKDAMQDIPKSLTFTQPAIEDVSDAEANKEPSMIGPVAEKYLRKFVSKDANADMTYGIYNKNGEFYIGDTKVGVIGDDISVGEKVYQGTPGLWELIVMRIPSEEVYTDEDYETYAEIMLSTNALRRGNSKDNNMPKASKGYKWAHLLKTIWDARKEFEGEGILKTVILPKDPKALLDRFELLMASKRAGNTGVRNELVSICDELKRQNAIDAKLYKQFLTVI